MFKYIRCLYRTRKSVKKRFCPHSLDSCICVEHCAAIHAVQVCASKSITGIGKKNVCN